MEKKPILFNFFQHCEDFVSLESAYALKRVAELYAKYGIRGDFYLTGLVSKKLLEKAPEVIQTLKHLEMPICYHGDNHVPFPTPQERIAEMEWNQAVEAMLHLESHEINPLTGEVDSQKLGGFALIKEVFGEAPIVTIEPLGAPVVYAHKLLGARIQSMDGSMLGYPLIWKMGMLCGTQAGTNYCLQHKYVLSSDFIDSLQCLIENLPRDRVNFISMPWHPYEFVLSRSLGRTGGKGWLISYFDPVTRNKRNPGSGGKLQTVPSLPLEEVERIFDAYERVVKFVVEHPEIRVVTCKNVLSWVEPLEEKRTLNMDRISATAEYLLSHWQDVLPHPAPGSGPPAFVDLGSDYLSLAEAFQVLTYSLSYYGEHGVLPNHVSIYEILGPVDAYPQRLAGFPQPSLYRDYQMILGEDVIAATISLETRIVDRIPGEILLGDPPHPINPAEFLYLMAQEFRYIEKRGKPSPTIYLTAHILPLDYSHREYLTMQPKDRRCWNSLAQLWTVKPARMRLEL